jgi:GT2 family glycosyltransferase
MDYNPKVSIIIVTYNNAKEIQNCINSVLKQAFEPFEIIIVDNASADNTVNLIRESFPDIRIIRNQDNIGFGGGNNTGVKHASGDIIVFLNPDTIVLSGWLEELVNSLVRGKKIIATSKILTYDGLMINTCGNIIHFTGLAFTRGYGSHPTAYPRPEYVTEASGCSFAIWKEDFIKIGGFDETIFLYHDDVDFSIRAHLMGYNILFVPSSTVKHNYTLNVTAQKLYHLERGRYIILRKYYSFYDIVKISPSLFVAELLAFGYALGLGYSGLRSCLQGMKEGLTVKVQHVSGDKEKLLRSISAKIPEGQLTNNTLSRMVVSFANRLFEVNSRLLRMGSVAGDEV